MSNYPRRRIVLDSTGKPVEETSVEGLTDAVAAYMATHPTSITPTGEPAPASDPGDITLNFENALI